MRRPHLFFLTVLWLAFVCQIVVAAESARAFRLDARSHWTIEFGGPTKIEVIRFAAEQLDVGLSRMLGWSARSALIERKWADAGYRIRLVTGGRSPSLAGATPKMAPGGEEFRIETAPDVIEVTASTPSALLFAVYSLLEIQGCHWLYPGAQGEVIPRKNELVFPGGQRGHRADLAMRGLAPVENLQRYSEQEISELLDWMAKNGFNHLCAIQNYGWRRLGATIRREAAKRDIQIVGYLWSFERLLPLELGQEHPEYFALIKGQRQVNYNIKRCASSPEAIALFVKNGVRFLRDSELNQWLISPNDGSHWCQCDGCKKLLPKDQWAAFFAPLAQAVARELPTIRLQNFVYRNRYDLPLDTAVYASPAMDHYFDVYPRNRWFTLRDPDGPPDKIELPFDPRAAKFSNNAYLADRLAAWRAVAKGRIWLFENLMLHGTYSLPVPNLHLIAGDLRAAAKERLDGYLFEAYAQSWNSFASDFWALGRLCWDTSLDSDRLQQEFFELLLGSQSSALGVYYREYPRRIAQEMRGVAAGGGPYGEVHWMHRMPQAAAAYTTAIRSIAPDGLSPAGQEWLMRQRQVVEIMDEIRHRSANPPVGILGTSKPDEILLLCEKALHATKGVDGIYFARWQLAGLFRRLYDGGQAEGCVLPNQFDAETRALFRDGKIWDTLAAWEDAGRFPRDPADPDREIREILLRAIRQARADLGAERKNP
jgi:hypothetical protein